jgi:hypothetical protein
MEKDKKAELKSLLRSIDKYADSILYTAPEDYSKFIFCAENIHDNVVQALFELDK